MDEKENILFSGEEKDILQEIMNIAFGNATADLAGVFDIYVNLDIPNIQVIGVGDLPGYIKNATEATQTTSIVDQKFWGDLSGSGVLVFPKKSGESLTEIIDDTVTASIEEKSNTLREKEIILEIGNILIGACVGKITELLSTFVTYSPPRVVLGNSAEYEALVSSYDPNQVAIVMKTLFTFNKKNINGLLLILTNQESILWLQNALHDFMKSYE